MAIDTSIQPGSTDHHVQHRDAASLSKKEEAGTNIIDIRSDTDGQSIADDLRQGLNVPPGKEKRLPTLLLYDEKGLKLFEGITYLEEYYLTNAEIEVLNTYADSIAQRISNGSMVVELGSGNLRKVNILLRALERAEKDVEYYALDLSLTELQRTLSDIPHGQYKHVKCFGLWGTYDDGLKWLAEPPRASRPKTILWLGSSIGNFTRDAGIDFVHSVAEALNIGDRMLVGIDACKDPARVYHAYNDKEGLTHRFILNGLSHANNLLGSDVFKLEDWQVIGEYDAAAGRHHAFVSPLKDVTVEGVKIVSGERIRIEESYKWSDDETRRLWQKAGLAEGCKWSNGIGDYALHMVSKPIVQFSPLPGQYAAKPVPTLSDWAGLWAAWDAVTRQMIPEEELLAKPIKLRNACIFYLGHIPTFLDIHLTRATSEPATEPKSYSRIFERGVDPDVENPELCHAHSEIPDEYPPLNEILAFQERVRQRVESLYKDGRADNNRKIGRALWLGYEHEIMHLETLLYMLVQSEKTLPPPGTVAPDFEALANSARLKSVDNEWFHIPERAIKVGTDDPQTDEGPTRYFSWDNEHPAREVKVGGFVAKGRPITNREYAEYLTETGNDRLPALWLSLPDTETNGEKKEPNTKTTGSNGMSNGRTVSDAYLQGKAIRTVYGPVPLKYALDWPLFASYDEVRGCAKWMGGRMPTADEARSIYAYAEELKENELEKAISTTIPAVNGHLVNDGVQETPPPNGHSNGHSHTMPGPNPHELFVDLEGANVGFAHWHPVPVTPYGNKLAGRGELGGVWEWTSTVLEPHQGFEAMSLYPGYTADFFDDKHNVVLGGSWATHPRVAGRRSFVNWYQRNYPYVWAGGRLVKDL